MKARSRNYKGENGVSTNMNTTAGILVEIPLNKESPKEVMVENECGRIVMQQVEYEWKSVMCSKCKNFWACHEECQRQEGEEEGDNRRKSGAGVGSLVTLAGNLETLSNADGKWPFSGMKL
ncbi:hypothetical protein HAX54_027914 [Datura stramonium]|uniref:Uncharacterized protein n=1 Tax=Datura stramonium TaxID=4076 RepID=A0ABS8V4S6_DATST|nr:hypothetical protein [Datura stramonium]